MATDVAYLVLACAFAVVPGLLVGLALGVRRLVVLLATAVPASVLVSTLTGAACAAVDVPFGLVAVLAVTVLIGLVGATSQVLRGGRRRRRLWPSRRDLTGLIAGGGLGILAVGAGVVTWMRGLVSLSTIPQEHDMITHVVVTAYVWRSGRAGPWQLEPADVLTGGSSLFYPAGLHVTTAPLADITGSVVPAVNAMTVVMLGVALPVAVGTLAVTGARAMDFARTTSAIAGGIAAVLAVSAYRPAFALTHDGGILANAVAIGIVPGVVAAVVLVRRSGWGERVLVGVSVAGVAAIHPSALVSVAVALVGWWTAELFTRRGRRLLGEAVLPVLCVVAVALVAALPTLLPGLALADRTTNWPADSSSSGYSNALGKTLGLTYSGFLDPDGKQSQMVLSLLVLLGVVVVLACRREHGLLGAWAAWSAVTLVSFLTPARGPVNLITSFYYNAQLRIWSHVYVFGAALAGVGLAVVAVLVARWCRRRLLIPIRMGAAGLGVLLAVGFLAGPGLGYLRVDRLAVATRYSTPDFTRVGPDDQAAISWLARRVLPGQRVLNSANDGSTYLYVEDGVPVVNIGTVGFPNAPYTYRLLAGFRSFPSDPALRAAIRQLNIRWIYVDHRAPGIGTAGAPQGWAPHGLDVPEGLQGLDGLPGVREEFRAGSVSVYSLDPQAVG